MDSFVRFCLPRRQALAICRASLYAMTGFLVCFLFFSPTGHSYMVNAQQTLTEYKGVKQFGNAIMSQAQLYIDPQINGNDPTIEFISWTEPSKPKTTSAWLHDNADFDSNDKNLLQTIRRMPDFMPDEIRMKALLAPFMDSEAQHLRDIALRTRALREAFTFWEYLHLVKSKGTLLQRDIVQRLRTFGLPSKDLGETIAAYDAFRSYINRLASRLFPWTMKHHADHMSLHASFYRGGRGIALTTGDEQAPYLLTSIPALRKLGCNLPIEVLYLGDSDLSEDSRDLLETMPNVITRDLSQMIDDAGWTLYGWAAKPFAILMSSFREVLFIDADALFFTNPETLFEDKQYLDTGALFFKDRNVSPESKRGWLRDVLPQPISNSIKRNRFWTGESGHMQDSGAIVVDKWKHFVSLLLVTRLNGPDRDGKDGKKGVYDWMYGDKETFWLGWEMAGDLDYAFHDGATGSMGKFQTPERKLVKTKEVEGLLDEIKARLIEPSHTEGDGAASLPTGDADPQNTDESAPEKPSICSPQLLHFDRKGNPLWFNGWLANDKSGDLERATIFEVAMKEPQKPGKSRSSSDKHPWTIHENNVLCLDSEDYTTLTEIDKRFLTGLQESARNVSATLDIFR